MDSHFIRVQESGYTSVKIGQKTVSFFSANVLEPGSPSQRFKVNLRTHIKKKSKIDSHSFEMMDPDPYLEYRFRRKKKNSSSHVLDFVSQETFNV